MQEIVIKALDDVKPYENKPRKNDAAVAKVAESIKLYGFKQPLVIDADGVIVVGHTRYRAAKLIGLEHVPCIISELSDQQNAEYRIVDNKTNEYAEWDWDKLKIELQGADLGAFAFDWDFPEIEPELKEDIPPEVPEEARTQLGDIVQIGKHRLICGDSTDAAVLKALMQDELADLVLTDPPYNVDYEGGTADKLKILNDKQEDGAFRQFLTAAFTAADSVLKPGGAFYIWHADSEGHNFRTACKDADWQIRQCLIWVKNSIVLGRQDYQWRHEPCLYGWKGGAAHYFTDSRAEATVIEDPGVNIDKLTKAEAIALLKEIYSEKVSTSVLFVDKPARSELHPTTKPIKLFGEQIKNSSKPGQIVLDSFGGSGTTLMTCEQLGRIARLVELDPHYCDVIVQRYVNLTGSADDVLIHRGGTVLHW